jgi:NADH-quinone oxidoreductase subunit J
MLNEITFYLTAIWTLVFAIAAMSLRQMVHCALSAAAAFAGLALIYLELNAPFVGFAQLLVYVGAIAILIVFAVLLTRGDEVGPNRSQASPSWLAGLAVALLVLGAIALPILSSPSLQKVAPPVATAPVKRIGEELMTCYVLPLETVGVLLTAAMIGAVVIALREESEKPAGQGTSLLSFNGGRTQRPATPETAAHPETEEAVTLP